MLLLFFIFFLLIFRYKFLWSPFSLFYAYFLTLLKGLYKNYVYYMCKRTFIYMSMTILRGYVNKPESQSNFGRLNLLMKYPFILIRRVLLFSPVSLSMFSLVYFPYHV
jgi:hypothetical protein